MADNFSVWIGRPLQWYKRDERTRSGWAWTGYPDDSDFTPRVVARGFQEPAEAADMAEEYLSRWGYKGQTWAELRLNGDKEPHTTIVLLDSETYGVFNAPKAPWPIFYPEDVAEMLPGVPEGFFRTEAEGEGEHKHEDENSDGFGDEDDDSKLMDLGAEPEKEADTDSEDESEEFPDDKEEEDEIEDESDDESEEDEWEDEEADPRDEESEDDSEDEDDDEQDEDAEDASDENEDGEAEKEGDGDEELEDENEEESEEEMELPRLKLFAKMRGPLGWRKRAELEELNERNVFAMKVGVLPDEIEDLTRAQQERDTFVTVEFIEKDENRKSGVLRMRLPDDVTLDDFKQLGSGWIVAEVPLPRDEQ